MKLTPKQESFCLAYLETGNASEAYRTSYDASKMKPDTVHRSSKELLDNPKITARLQELRAPIVKKAQITLESHLARLDDLSRGAESEGKYAEAIKAEELRGKAAGLYTERQQIDHTTNGESINAISPAQAAIERFKKSNEPEQ